MSSRVISSNISTATDSPADDRRRPRLAPPLPDADEQRLIQPERDRLTDPARVLDQRGAVRDDGVVNRVPVAAQLERDLVHGATMSADLLGHPPARPVGHPEPRRG